jgi:hypothetical protein
VKDNLEHLARRPTCIQGRTDMDWQLVELVKGHELAYHDQRAGTLVEHPSPVDATVGELEPQPRVMRVEFVGPFDVVEEACRMLLQAFGDQSLVIGEACNADADALRLPLVVDDEDGGLIAALTAALSAPLEEGKPSAIIARTVKGRGVSFMEDVGKWHHGVPNDDEYARALAEIDAALAKFPEATA